MPVVALLFQSSPAGASTVGGGVVTGIYVNGGGVALIDTTGTRTTPPACSTSYWAFSISTTTGQAMLAQLLTAMHTKSPVDLVGTANCSAWPDRETILQAHTSQP
jgi:hypothetical protein